MTGQWPPEWEDPDGDVGAEAGQAAPETDVRLSDVTAYLAALPGPVLPDAIAARISAAIAAEAADRAASPASGGRTLERGSRRPRIRRPGKFALRSISSVAACLVIAGFGYLLTQAGGSSSSSSAATAASAQAAGGAQERTAASPVNGPDIPAAAARPSAVASASAFAGRSGTFTVISSGDVYQKSTLVSEVRERLHASSSLAHTAPTSALIGCVFHFTDSTVPGLVDEASYAGQPVYVIATSSRAWVVGRGCTATDSELITSVSLAGLRGNLSALGSVEG